jgi:hypothetical protein
MERDYSAMSIEELTQLQDSLMPAWTQVSDERMRQAVELAKIRLELFERKLQKAFPGAKHERLAVLEVMPSDDLVGLDQYLNVVTKIITVEMVIRDESKGRLCLIGRKKTANEAKQS